MAEIVSLAEAVEHAIADGDTVAMEGFTHLIPFAAGHEVIRQRRRDLTLVRMTPDLIYDQLIGAGCASKLVFSWGGNPGVGSLHRFRDAVEHGWPGPLELEEHSHAGMANRYVAGASGLPFAVLRGYNGTGLETLSGASGVPGTAPTIKPITCPFTGETLTAVAALRPDVAVIHAQRADRSGNVQLWGITGVQKEAVLASRRSVVTVEEIVDELDPRPGAVVLPGWTVTFVAQAPGGARPSYALGYSIRDNDYYVAWDAIARDRDSFTRWLDEQVYGVTAGQS
jgi:glutaconate CoA-transferase subunit A